MSDKPKFPQKEAMAMALVILGQLAPFCYRAVIAGSLRRCKPFVGDAEILFIPKTEQQPDPEEMFNKLTIDLAAQEIGRLEGAGVLRRRPSKTGCETYGPKNKLMIHAASGLPIDLFATTEENWWVSLVIRTGSKETNLRLTTGAQNLGRTLNAVKQIASAAP